jgi:uncharacterized protein YidB (DUF937 family)
MRRDLGDLAMDDLGMMLGSLGGGTAGAGATGDMAGSLGGLIGSEGGLDGLLGQLQAGGLGEQVQPWVGTGPNEPVDPDQLASALGPDKVNQLASQTGIDIGALLPMLAVALPTIIDALTPDGQVPTGTAAGAFDLGSVLGGLGRSATPGSASGSGSSGVPDIGSVLGDKE